MCGYRVGHLTLKLEMTHQKGTCIWEYTHCSASFKVSKKVHFVYSGFLDEITISQVISWDIRLKMKYRRKSENHSPVTQRKDETFQSTIIVNHGKSSFHSMQKMHFSHSTTTEQYMTMEVELEKGCIFQCIFRFMCELSRHKTFHSCSSNNLLKKILFIYVAFVSWLP